MFYQVSTSMKKIAEKKYKQTNWRQRATHEQMDRAY